MSEPGRPFDLDAFLGREAATVQEALARAMDRLAGRVPDVLLPPIRQGVLAGGKRLRPILCVAAFRACGGVGDPHDLAAALELIHGYSLMHDDLPCMDDAALRRGEPTPHTLFGERRTLQAGAVLIPAAALQAWEAAVGLGCPPERAREIVRELCRAAGAGGMVGGQALDLLAEGKSLSGEELEGLHRRKTGALLAASLRIGALAAGASVQVQAALERYGRAIGLAFQIADDILDATGSASDLGKHPSDATLGKSTYVALYGLEGARKRALGQSEAALSALSDAKLDDPALRSLATYVVDRRT